MKLRYFAVCAFLYGCAEPAPPTASLTGHPGTVEQGQCASLSWSSANASEIPIDQDVGKVDPSGSEEVCPGATTQYTITAMARAAVRRPPPRPST